MRNVTTANGEPPVKGTELENAVNDILSNNTPSWSIQTIREEENNDVENDTSTIEAILTHSQTGSILQLFPVDHSEHMHDAPVYTTHRLRLRDNQRNKTEYVTLTDDNPMQSDAGLEQLAIDVLIESTTPKEAIQKYSQKSVHESDHKAAANNTKREMLIKTVPQAIYAIIGAAQELHSSTETQSELGAFG